jgi:AcrR family transcriptional regulator
MGARAESAERTGRQIQAAAIELFRRLPFEQVTLEAIAARAGVTLQTVLRRFGSKEGLFEATARAFSAATSERRIPERPNDVIVAIRALVRSYEEMGDLGWRALCQEEQFDFLHEVLSSARMKHRAWVETTFASALEGVGGQERARRTLLLFSATDYYVYKLLRRDLGKDGAQTSRLMVDLVSAALSSFATRAPREKR